MKNSSLIAIGILFLHLFSCTEDPSNRLNFEEKGRAVPDFSADSAYHFVQKQIQFGPRNPNSTGHKETKNYLLNKLRQYAGSRSVFAQEFTHVGYGSDTLSLYNIIASFNPQSNDRIMLCAHWDTRPRGEEDPEQPDQPILGADDGGSGVAVLLELARLMSRDVPQIGVDIILFDGEDYGKSGSLEQYFLGSRYWANNPPVSGYRPRFGILLDMVAGEGARFPKEQYSVQYAPALVSEIWSIAAEKGYGDIFIDKQGAYISDDHVVINRILNIPTIDVIRHEPGTQEVVFAPYWHTQQDDMNIISRETLEAVGEVMVELIYNRI
jgi:hypothetical protein